MTGYFLFPARTAWNGSAGILKRCCCDWHQSRAGYFTKPRIKATISFFSASLTWEFGGMGIVPHAPLPPLVIFSLNLAAAFASFLYFLATSIQAGPTNFLSIVWQELQLYLSAQPGMSGENTPAAAFFIAPVLEPLPEAAALLDAGQPYSASSNTATANNSGRTK